MHEALTSCIPQGGGLYLPSSLPRIPSAFIQNAPDMSLREIAYATSNVFLGEDLDSLSIKKVVDNAFSFDIPLIEIDKHLFVLELFHGPTGVFKDIGSRFLAGLLSEIDRHDGVCLNVLVSTTGNTGMAVANAFGGVSDINTFILYPHGTVSKNAAVEMAATGDNVHVLEVGGNIDDCRTMVAQAFEDVRLRENLVMSSANSTNFARLIPQVALFFYAAAQLKKRGIPSNGYDMAIPSGNLGMVTSGLMAKMIGLECGGIIAACNSNNAFDRYLKTGVFSPCATIRTYAHLMDMASPSNLPRLKALCGGNIEILRKEIMSATVGDELIAMTMNRIADSTGYIIDPHTAVGMAALLNHGRQNIPGLVFATADPAKSAKTIESILGRKLINRDDVRMQHHPHNRPERVAPTYPALKKYLLSHQ